VCGYVAEELANKGDSQLKHAHPARGSSIKQVLNTQLPEVNRFDWSRAAKCHYQTPSD
jgi:hypothetical protein